jgi:hypothetical protein
MIKKILIALVVLIAAAAGFIALQPAEFRVERSATIAAPPAQVFAQVNDLRKWDAWSPWAKLDPDAKVGFEGPSAGKDAAMTWSGNQSVGEGRMTVTESRPNELITIAVALVKPMAGSSTSQFAFKPDGSGTTVTWTMSGHHDFVGKAMCLIMNGRKMMGGEMEKGLAQLKVAAEGAGSA